METVADEYGRIDTLVNNVGGGPSTDHLEDVSLEEWETTMNLTPRSHWLCAKHAIEFMPRGSSIVNVSSTEANATVPGFAPYDAAKAGVNGLTRAMAVDLGELGIRSNAVEPGGIENDRPNANPDELAQETPMDPAERWGVPRDVAPVVAFLASDDARFVTGATIPVDGGRQSVLIDGQYYRNRRCMDGDEE